MAKTWTTEEIEIVRKYAKEGLTSGMIARELGPSFTRNQIVGICARNNIQLGGKIRSANVKLEKPQIVAKPRSAFLLKKKPQKLPPQPIPPEEIIFSPFNKNILSLGMFDCRAIIGEVDGVNTIYCGDNVVPEKHWCRYHFNMYTIPMSKPTERYYAKR